MYTLLLLFLMLETIEKRTNTQIYIKIPAGHFGVFFLEYAHKVYTYDVCAYIYAYILLQHTHTYIYI